jgi:hypothetical protein
MSNSKRAFILPLWRGPETVQAAILRRGLPGRIPRHPIAQDERSIVVGHGAFSDSNTNAIINPNPSITNLPYSYLITYNDTGGFFVPTANNIGGQYVGGSAQAQVFIAVHELAHYFNSAGIVPDYGNQSLVQANDALVRRYCGRLLDAASAI